MADYKRMISYMYQYENGVKRRNVGYARIEAKSGQVKITLHMQLLGQLDSIFPTYIIHREEQGVNLIYLGDTALKNQVMDGKLTAEENNIMNTGSKLSEMGGLLLFMHDNVFFASEWDDKPIVAKELLDALKPKKQEAKVIADPEPEKYLAQPASRRVGEISEDQKAAETMAVRTEPVNPEPLSPEGLSLAEEINMPKYKLPRGLKTIERQQKPIAAEISKPAEEELLAASISSKDQQTRKEQSENQQEQALREETMLSNKQEPEADVTNMESEQNQEPEEDVPNWESEQNQEPEADVPNWESEQNQEPEDDVPNWESVQSQEPEADIERQDDVQEEEEDLSSVERMQEQGLKQSMRQEPEGRRTEEEAEKAEHPVAKHLFDRYPRIYPFEDNEILLCVKIEPKDIGMLPKDLWALSNNSFLMHGFYCYHHLIFAKLKDRYGCRYILGIPGIYHSRERFMARMFGFESFKSIRKRELQQGDFGYWYLEVNF